jgi:hypothetical protein
VRFSGKAKYKHFRTQKDLVKEQLLTSSDSFLLPKRDKYFLIELSTCFMYLGSHYFLVAILSHGSKAGFTNPTMAILKQTVFFVGSLNY